MTLPHYFHLGVDAEDYVSPTYSVSYSNWDLDEGLPDDELVGPEFGEPDFAKLPEECPHDFGPLEIEEPDHDE